jgi:1-acyl-sn-glycerol-3-phosphate acyltransferase
MKWGYRITSSAFYIFFKLFHRHRVYGLENLPKGPAIIAPNHLSLYDPPLVSCSIPEELHFVAKKGLFDSTLFASIITYLNAHPISGSEQDLTTIKLICRLLQNGNKVVIFPEGSRSEDGELLELKQGVGMLAIRNNVPIVPVHISGTFEVWPIHNKWPRLFGRTSCTIGKPIHPDQYDHLSKKEAQAAITKDLQSALIGLRG